MLRRIAPVWFGVLLAGCNTLPEAPRASSTPIAPAPSSDVIHATQLASYVQDLQGVVQGSPTEQAEVMERARAGYDQARQGPAVLRYALLLAAPGHPARDPAQAQRLLYEALARPELLSSTERALAVVELQRVDAELRLKNENERLIASAQQQQRDQQRNTPALAALQKRLQTEMEEKARVLKELDEARAKLEAIADIERRNSDRPPATEGRTP